MLRKNITKGKKCVGAMVQVVECMPNPCIYLSTYLYIDKLQWWVWLTFYSSGTVVIWGTVHGSSSQLPPLILFSMLPFLAAQRESYPWLLPWHLKPCKFHCTYAIRLDIRTYNWYKDRWKRPCPWKSDSPQISNVTHESSPYQMFYSFYEEIRNEFLSCQS
jgi:hypothetical protein